MEYQKFIPEGWMSTKDELNVNSIHIAFNNGNILQGKVSKCDSNCNLHVDLGNNIKGIIPRNEFAAINTDEFGFCNPNIYKNKVNNFVQFKIKEIYNDENVLLSRKKVQQEALEWVKNDLNVGDVVKGIIKNIRKFGVFVEIGGGIVGLLHIEDISVSRIKSPEERFSIGEKTIVEGIVKETDKFKNGIFIELKPNLVGLAEYKEGLKYGQKVNVYIKKIINDRKKIKLLIV